LLPSLARLQTQLVLVSGGEPLIHPQWAEIAQLLRDHGLHLWLLTAGLSLAKHARRAAQLFDAITVSLDGADGPTYAEIRGLDAFDNVCAGIEACADVGMPVGLRTTLQKANYRQLPQLIALARRLRARQISFLAVDVANPHAFGRTEGVSNTLALARDDLTELERILTAVEQDYAADFRSGFIAESPRKLRQIHQYFAAVCGAGTYPPVRCNAPEVSAVIDAQGHVSPCFFIPGPADAKSRLAADFEQTLNAPAMMALRRDIRAGSRPECVRCVCSLWREPDSLTVPRPIEAQPTVPREAHA
jgi:Fe-coproporphyrin III synthase